MQAFTTVDRASCSTQINQHKHVLMAELPYLPIQEGAVYTAMVGWHLWLAVKQENVFSNFKNCVKVYLV
jgi:hypothetical protein